MKVKETLAQTRIRRKSQICKVFEIKFDKSHLSKQKLNYLNMLFVEAKWIYNHQLASKDIFKYSDKIKTVEVLTVGKDLELRAVQYLSSQMKQGLVDRTKQNVINLAKKENGKGRLKFKSEVNSIPLKQYNNTYYIVNGNYVKLQGFKKNFRVIGLNQIRRDYEIANAILIKKNGNFYIKITCFQVKESKERTGNQVGLDFGIKDSVVDSNGRKFNFQFPESKKLKKWSKKFNKAKKESKNRYKQKLKLNKQYEKLNNRKKDAKNKFVAKLVKENDLICIQDEMIHQWHKSKMKGWGRKIQQGISGGIISELKKHSETLLIHRSFPSTQLCSNCGSLNKHSLDKRTYKCDCGYSMDRDIHSANNILVEGLRISKGLRNTMPVEKILDLGLQTKQSSMKQEALA